MIACIWESINDECNEQSFNDRLFEMDVWNEFEYNKDSDMQQSYFELLFEL